MCLAAGYLSHIPRHIHLLPPQVRHLLLRFDDSRNTHVYLIISCIAFYIGSMAWMTMTIFNVHAWPFALFSETLLLLTVVLFATKRNEIRIIWNGKFYDE